MKITDFAYHLSRYLGNYLPGQYNFSANSIAAYRDVFKLVLKFFRENKGIAPDKLRIADFGKPVILEFIDWLKTDRHCGQSTILHRLTVIRSFFSYLQMEVPEYLFLCQNILWIEFKRQIADPPMKYLTFDGIKSILARPNQNTKQGRRDLVMFALMYDSGARVQEIVDLRVRDIRLANPMGANLLGKGSKWRFVQLMKDTAELIGEYLVERGLNTPEKYDLPLFVNKSGQKLTRAGIAFLLGKYAAEAKEATPALVFSGVTPHTFRHSRAMHLLQAGVDLIYIRDLLGHSDVKTTEIYARVDSDAKRKALESVYKSPLPITQKSWTENEALMRILQGLV